jgi:hypothetical protein
VSAFLVCTRLWQSSDLYYEYPIMCPHAVDETNECSGLAHEELLTEDSLGSRFSVEGINDRPEGRGVFKNCHSWFPL